MKKFVGFLMCLFVIVGPAVAEDTRLEVRALTLDAKFIGTSMSGMAVVIEDANTDEILDTGVTSGTTGNTERILGTTKPRHSSLSDEESAVYVSQLNIEEPRRVRVTVRGPIGQPQAQAEASSVR